MSWTIEINKNILNSKITSTWIVAQWEVLCKRNWTTVLGTIKKYTSRNRVKKTMMVGLDNRKKIPIGSKKPGNVRKKWKVKISQLNSIRNYNKKMMKQRIIHIITNHRAIEIGTSPSNHTSRGSPSSRPTMAKVLTMSRDVWMKSETRIWRWNPKWSPTTRACVSIAESW